MYLFSYRYLQHKYKRGAIPPMITYGGPELFVGFIVIVITPLVYWLILKRFRFPVKIISILALWALAVFIAYWDVYQISKEARRLCKEEAGLHVYKTVEAEGFLGSVTGIANWSEYGFQYVEGIYKGKKTRATLKNGNVVYEVISEYTSRYQSKSEEKKFKKTFVKHERVIMDRDTGEILGEEVGFKVYPGWLDRWLLGKLGFTWIPSYCDGDYPPERGKTTLKYEDLIKAVIRPKNLYKGK